METTDEMQARWSKAIAEAGAQTESEMRDAKVPWPKTEDELLSYIKSLVDRPHDYGTCVYAMSMAACAAFYYVSHMLGVTGFQASCADLDIIRRTRNLKIGFSILDYSKLLYPQYCDEEHFPSYLTLLKTKKEMLKEGAQKLLSENKKAHPNVVDHWKKIAGIQEEGNPQ